MPPSPLHCLIIIIRQPNYLPPAAAAKALSPFLPDVDPKDAGNKPGYAADETESFRGFPVSAGPFEPNLQAKELSAVDRPDDEPESSPPANRYEKV